MSTDKKLKMLVVVESMDVNDSSGTKGRVALIQNMTAIGINIKVIHYTRRKVVNIPGVECIAISEKKFNLSYFLSRLRRVLLRYLNWDVFKALENNVGFSFGFHNDSKSIGKFISKYASDQDYILTMSKGSSFRTHHAMLNLSDLHSKWISYIHDPYPYSCYPEPYFWLEPAYKKKEQFFKSVSEKAKYHVLPSKLLLEWMGQFYPSLIEKGIIIPHQCVSNINDDADIPSFFTISKFNILHAGNLLKQRTPEGLLKGFELFLNNNKEAQNEVELLLIGKVSFHNELLDNFANRIPQLKIIRENLPFETVIKLQKKSSVNVILEANANFSPFLPGKFPHCVLADKPILFIGPNDSEVMRLLGQDYSYQSTSMDAILIAKLIEKLYLSWKISKMKMALNRIDISKYIGVEFLESVFEEKFYYDN